MAGLVIQLPRPASPRPIHCARQTSYLTPEGSGDHTADVDGSAFTRGRWHSGGMGTVIDLIATIITVLGLLAALGYGGYLLLLSSQAAKRPGANQLATDMRKRLPAAGGLALGAIVALLLTGGGVPLDVIGLLVGGGVGLASVSQLQNARRRLASPPM